MLTTALFLASVIHHVPESGLTAALVIGGVLTLGLVARFVNKRSK